MGRSFNVYCDDEIAREVSSLAKLYSLTEGEVIRQLVEIGLEEVDTIERNV